MKARAVHAVLAAALENPSLIERWRADSDLLAANGVSPAAVDLGTLSQFAGLTLKVRHNPLREMLPSTFRLLGVLEIDISVFAAYAADLGSRGARLASTTEDRIRCLIEFLARWLDLERVDYALLWDVIRHEQTVATLVKHDVSPICTRHRSELVATSVPHISGDLVLHELSCDPREISAALWVSQPSTNELEALRRSVYLAYWRPPDESELHIVELDAFGYYVLKLVDGVRTATQLHRDLCGGRRATRTFLRLLAQLGATGLLTFEGPT